MALPVIVAGIGGALGLGYLWKRTTPKVPVTPAPDCGSAASGKAIVEGVQVGVGAAETAGGGTPPPSSMQSAADLAANPCWGSWLPHWGDQVNAFAFHAFGQPISDAQAAAARAGQEAASQVRQAKDQAVAAVSGGAYVNNPIGGGGFNI